MSSHWFGRVCPFPSDRRSSWPVGRLRCEDPSAHREPKCLSLDRDRRRYACFIESARILSFFSAISWNVLSLSISAEEKLARTSPFVFLITLSDLSRTASSVLATALKRIVLS